MVAKRGDKDYYVRGTFTSYNLDFSNDVLHFYDKGFKKNINRTSSYFTR